MKQEIINYLTMLLKAKGYKIRSVYIEEIFGEFGEWEGSDVLDVKSQLVIRAKK